MGYVPQSVYLIDESIRKNVAFGVPEHGIDDAKVLHALQQARIDQFVLSRPDGLGFNVGENGSRLSGGQRQRIGIARALYFDADTIVFDEVTSALDAATAIEVLAEIRSMRGSKTLILVSHDDRVLAICDAVYEVADGSVAQRA
jgi:ABC-type bacteriocin/lantibiotic exporter with double-glycine peptidase domain